MIRQLIYIYQSEYYDIRRFLQFVYSHRNWLTLEKRGTIVWTAKARLIWFGTWIMALLLMFLSVWQLGWGSVLVAALEVIVLPLLIVLVSLLLWPVDRLLKQRTLSRAREILKNTRAKKIGITGSYGKTTTKEILATILSSSLNVVKTPENVNTDIGIADFILKHAADIQRADALVVEMGAHHRGDIEALCRLIEPDYGVLTGIAPAHLDRFGSMDVLIAEKFKLPEMAKEESFLNGCDAVIASVYQSKNPKHPLILQNNEITEITYKPQFSGISFMYRNTVFEMKLLSDYAAVLTALCAEVATRLGISYETASIAARTVSVVPHRLQPIYNQTSGITVIDDSYNGNSEGIKKGLEVLSRAEGRKVVITPGLVETGTKTAEIHKEIGKWYAEKADLVILIDTSASAFIKQGMDEAGFTQYKVYSTVTAAHQALASELRRGDTIIFQNDWSDNYA